VTYANSNIRSFEDVRGKKVFLGPPGGGAWDTARQWLETAAGLKVNKDFDNVKASWSSAAQGFQDRQFDVFITSGIAPYPQVEQLALTSKLYILGLTKAEFEANEKAVALTKIPGRGLGIIPQGIYGRNVINTEDIYTLQSIVGVAVHKSMSDDKAYLITKTFWEGAKKSVEAYPWLQFVTLELAVKDGGLKLHPGVARYYREIGLSIPAGSAP
jgi:TRAP transporter TAXI family solute receptor